MGEVVVYADILIIVNFVVDYFLISIAAHFLNKKPRLWRLLLSAGTGGIFSLY
ncbi:MAG: sigma-E processing peptidase SpoIIGA, partial [Clostridia bacterium]|nr:sigma-E processing peptidase SpoIIGA [Clostridia bacterium]